MWGVWQWMGGRGLHALWKRSQGWRGARTMKGGESMCGERDSGRVGEVCNLGGRGGGQRAEGV